MSIRRLDAEDAVAMSEIHALCFERGWPTSEMKDHLEKDICIGTGNPLSGFVILRCASDQAEILTIAVHPEFRRQGLAHKILLTGEKVVTQEGSDVIFLEVAEDNPGAIAFYKSLSYVPVGKRPAYYKRPEGRVGAEIFRKDLVKR